MVPRPDQILTEMKQCVARISQLKNNILELEASLITHRPVTDSAAPILEKALYEIKQWTKCTCHVQNAEPCIYHMATEALEIVPREKL